MQQLDILIKNRELLLLVYWFGKGVMYSKQIEEYMEKLNGKSKSTTRRDLKDLEMYKIIDIKKMYNVNYVKLKVAALRFILHKTNKQLRAVSYKTHALKRSAFINEIVLTRLKRGNMTVDTLIKGLSKSTTLIDKDKNHELYMNGLLEFTMNGYPGAYEQINKELKSFLEEGTSMYKDDHIVSFNQMPNRNMYMLNLPKWLGDDIRPIDVAILNINNNLEFSKAIEKMNASHSYLHKLMQFCTVNFIIYNMEDGANSYFEDALAGTKKEYPYSIEIISLNLSARFFSNKIIVS